MKKLAFLVIPIVASALYWYEVATPTFCDGLCCVAERFCPKVGTHGSVDDHFQSIQTALEESLTKGWDLGASVYVSVDGESVVDVVGGFKDRGKTQPYDKDTMSLIFSSGKVLEGMAVAIAMEKGYLDYNDKIAQHWSEFAQAGKQDVTIADLLQHRSGLGPTGFQVTPNVTTLADESKRDVFLASQKFPFKRGHVAYRGWGSALYTDAIIRRVDPSKRSLAAFVQEELMADGMLVCPPIQFENDKRLTKVYDVPLPTTLLGVLPQVLLSPNLLRAALGPSHPLVFSDTEAEMVKHFILKDTPEAIQPGIPDIDGGAASYNNESSFLAYPMLSSNCFSNAKSIGSAADRFFRGKVVGQEIVKEFSVPLAPAIDGFSQSEITYSKGGFGVGGCVLLPVDDRDCIGWGGVGGSILQHCQIDGKAVTIAYVPNGLSPRVSNTRGVHLLNLVHDAMQS